MHSALKILLALVLAAAPLAAQAESWTYTDGAGETITLGAVPQRIIATEDAAAALIPLGIRPVGIIASSQPQDSRALQGLDLTGIEMVGVAYNEVDIEKAAMLQPDLVIAEYWPGDREWGGGPAVTGPDGQLRALAPVTGPAQLDSVVGLIEEYEKLAISFGADLSTPEIAAAKTNFERARDAFSAAAKAKPNLTALAVWAGDDGLWVAAPEGSAELMDLKRWGLGFLKTGLNADSGYWETVSWERSDTYQPDIILIDNRKPTNRASAEAKPTWTAMKAAAAGAIGEWPAYWLRNYTAYAGELDKLTAVVAAADENLTTAQ
ncbi:ABC transporter substrate-binding protein [Devosia sp. ZW T5_3]|uniref:ABC transporter substrate-binding protein n=1 Tax=Devosia sp. ZW T5_3 TaxID=3378085 RepID=UPI00385433D7